MLDFDWLEAKLRATEDVRSLISDYRFFENDLALSLVEAAIRLSAPVLATQPTQLATQLHGRLTTIADPEIQALLKQAQASTRVPWLRALRQALVAPGGPLFATLEGHTGKVNSVAITADGRWVISASEDGDIRIWDRRSAALVSKLKGHSGPVRAVTVTADGHWIISGSRDTTVRVWDRKSASLSATLSAHSSAVNTVAASADGRWIVSGSDDMTVRIWDRSGRMPPRILSGHSSAVNGVAFSANGQWVVSGSSDRTIRVWDSTSGIETQVLGVSQSVIYSVAVMPGDSSIIASTDGGIAICDLQTREVRALNSESGYLSGLAVSTDGRLVLVSSGWMLVARDMETGAAISTLRGHSGYVPSVALNADARWAVSGSADRTVRVWNLQGQADSRDAMLGDTLVTADGRWAVTRGDDATVVWDVERALPARKLPRIRWGRALTRTPEGRFLAVGSERHRVKLWNLETGEARILGGETRTDAAAFSYDGRWLVVGSDDFGDDPLVVWDAQSGRRVIDPDAGAIRAVAISPDGRWIVASFNGIEKRISAWDRQTGKEVHSWNRLADVLCVSANDHWLFAGCGREIVSFDLETGIECGMLSGHKDSVTSLAASRDGRLVISGSLDWTIRAWNRESGSVTALFRADAPITMCALAPDERTIVASDSISRLYFLRIEDAGVALPASGLTAGLK